MCKLPTNPSARELELMWDELSNIPIDSDDRLEVAFYDFTIGEHIYNVWHWFDHFNYLPNKG